MNPEGGGVSAWPSADAQGDPAVAVREDFPDGRRADRPRERRRRREVGGTRGRALGPRRRARRASGRARSATPRSSRAAGHRAARRTPDERAQRLDQPVRRRRSLAACVSANGPLTYTSCSTAIRGDARGRPRACASTPTRLSAGRHSVQLLATDINGQSTLSSPSTLLIDGSRRPCQHRARTGDEATASACASATPSPASTHATSAVSFGDGARAAGRLASATATARAGVYRVVVRVRDKLGQHRVVTAVGERAMKRLSAYTVAAPLALSGVATLLCAAPRAADADVFGPISLVSEGPLDGGPPQQAEYAHDAAISGNGEYVAFDGSVGGVQRRVAARPRQRHHRTGRGR